MFLVFLLGYLNELTAKHPRLSSHFPSPVFAFCTLCLYTIGETARRTAPADPAFTAHLVAEMVQARQGRRPVVAIGNPLGGGAHVLI